MGRRVALVLVALALAGCAGDGSEDPPATDPTVQTLPSTTATPAVADPFAVPQVIDIAYANRVLAAIDKVLGDAVRDIAASGTVTRGALERVRAVYNDPELEKQMTLLTELVSEGLPTLQSPPGDRQTQVARILVARPDCMVVAADTNYSAVVRDPLPPRAPNKVDLLALRPTQPGADPNGLNQTPWSISHDFIVEDPSGQEALCAG